MGEHIQRDQETNHHILRTLSQFGEACDIENGFPSKFIIL